jgi:uncharacterized metal-binding protein YceD (DUF177 family)
VTAPEFSRTVRVDTLAGAPRMMAIEAEEDERSALAERFGFLALSRLEAEVEVVRNGEAVSARGTLRAALAQACVVSGEPVEEEVEEAFAIEFRPHPAPEAAEEEIELGGEELDVVFHDGAVIDVGEAVAETLSLAVHPYPRAPAAEAALREAGVRSEGEARLESSPFAALKGKLGK